METHPAKDSMVVVCSRVSETSMSPLLASQVGGSDTEHETKHSEQLFFWSFKSIIKLKSASVLRNQGLKLMTTSRKDPRLEFWPLPVVVPAVSGNHWCQSVSRPTLHVLYNSDQPGKLHWFLITGIKKRGENKFKHMSVIFNKNKKMMNNDLPMWVLQIEITSRLEWWITQESRAICGFQVFAKFKLTMLTLTSLHYHPTCVL